MRQMTDGRSQGLGRSFIKGPRFFVKPSSQNCCEKCVYGTGEHAKDCVTNESGPRRGQAKP
jgi:hypothetical protein